MGSLQKTLKSSIGAKSVMAITGILLLGFVIGHLLGNLQVFAGREKLNAYAKMLKDLGPGLWAMRLGLLGIFLLHVGSAFRLVMANKAARPEKYVVKKDQATTFAARTMWMSGLIVLAFVVYHLLHFTLGVTNPDHMVFTDDAGRHDVYKMVILGFRMWPIAIAYVVAQIILGLHISHGVSSAFQTLGVRHPRLVFLKTGLGKAVAAVIVLGNCAIPLSIALGLVGKEVV